MFIIGSVMLADAGERRSMCESPDLPDHVEIRLDNAHPDDAFEAARALQSRKIAACRRKEDGGFFSGSEHERIALLERAVTSGLFDYVDVEVNSDAISLFKKHAERKFILSFHDVTRTPADLSELYARLVSIKRASLYKLVTHAREFSDNIKIKEILRQARAERIPLISFCMGEKGGVSRILCLSWGSAAVYASLGPGYETAPGQISCSELKKIYQAEALDPEAKIFGLLGCPLRHSLSPAVHNAAYRSEDLHYVCIPFETRSVEEVFRLHDEFNIAGFAVTSPLKKEAMEFVRSLAEDARQMGSVNTLIRDDSTFSGFNTDSRAFLDVLKEKVPRLSSEKIAILGDGGAARAAAFALSKTDADFRIFSRHREKGEDLASKYRASWDRIEEIGNYEYTVLVNCTTAGMYPQTGRSPIGEEQIRGKLVLDLIYNPPRTKLMGMAASKGIAAMNGRDMFIRQAALQFELLTKRKAPLRIMEDAFEEGLHLLDKADGE